MMRILYLFSLLLLTTGVKAQTTKSYDQIDQEALQIPDRLTKSTRDIADYIKQHFDNPDDRSRAIFVWIARNIQYDLANMFAINFYENTSEVIDDVLKNRKGVCMHFAELYNEIANQSGIKSYVIAGYTKQNGFVDYIPHAWCGSLVGTDWYLFDPTWGSGYVQNEKFVNKLNNYYFKAKPEQLISSHMPFDPLWQFLSYPVTNQEFYEGKTSMNKTKPEFNYLDTLKQYEQQSETERLVSSAGRIEKNGVRNSMISDRLQHIKREIGYYNNKQMVETFNAATSLYNSGVNQLNQFINYRNSQFSPSKPDSEIQEMVDVAEKCFLASRDKLKEIKNPDPNVAGSIAQLNGSIDESMKNLAQQKDFLDKYFKTGKMFRKSLFYKYKWMGVPLN
ncbi:MAG: transglutaminase domain-containing protein [Prolixibacteraceae bacterium]